MSAGILAGEVMIAIAADASEIEGASLKTRLALASINVAGVALIGALSPIGVKGALALHSLGTAAVKTAGALTLLSGAGGTVSVGFAYKLAADLEQTHVAFETMIGDAGRAKQLLQDVSTFAAATPLQSTELTNSARKLLAFGTPDTQIIPTLRVLGDVATGVQMPLEELAEIYGKNRVQGRLFMIDINQLQNRGIPIVAELAKHFGVTEVAVRKMVEEGKVGFPEMQTALQNLTKDGAIFNRMMERQSQTDLGKLSTIADNLTISLRDMGQAGSTALGVKGVLQAIVLASEDLQWATGNIRDFTLATNQYLGGNWLKQNAPAAVYETLKKPIATPHRMVMAGMDAALWVNGLDRNRLQEQFEIVKDKEEVDPVAALNERWKDYGRNAEEAGRRAERMFEQTRTPLEKLKNAQKELILDFVAYGGSNGALGRGLLHLQNEYKKDAGIADREKEIRQASIAASRRSREMVADAATPYDNLKKTISEAYLYVMQEKMTWNDFSKVLKHARNEYDELVKSRNRLHTTFVDNGLKHEVRRGLEANELVASVRTPTEQLREHVEDLYGRFRRGEIDQQTLNRNLFKSERELLGDIATRAPGAANADSREAYSAFLRENNRATRQGEAQRMLEEIKRQIKATQENTDALKDAERALRDPPIEIIERIV